MCVCVCVCVCVHLFNNQLQFNRTYVCIYVCIHEFKFVPLSLRYLSTYLSMSVCSHILI